MIRKTGKLIALTLLLSTSAATPLFAETKPEDVQAFKDAYTRFQDAANDYDKTVSAIGQSNYQHLVHLTDSVINPKIDSEEKRERAYREKALVKFKTFVNEHPHLPNYTPDALYRLADLLFEKSNDDYLLADEKFRKALDEYKPGSNAPQPVEPTHNFYPTIQVLERLIRDYPTFKYLDGAYYLLAFSYQAMDKDEKGLSLYTDLIKKFPNSPYVPEAWIRIGEYHFAANNLELATAAYREAERFTNSPFYDKALYKLAWTYYRRDDYDRAIKLFKKLVEWAEKKKAKTGEASSVRDEALQYMAVSLTESDWNLNGKSDAEFGLKRVLKYLEPGQPYNRELLGILATFLLDQDYYKQAIEIIQYTLANFPNDKNNPKLNDQLVTALLRSGEPEKAFAERSKLAQLYGPGTKWYKDQEEQGNIGAVEYAKKLIRDGLMQSAEWYHADAQRLRQEAKVNKNPRTEKLAEQRYEQAAKAYQAYIDAYPDSPDSLEMAFNLADCLYYSQQYSHAFKAFRLVREADVPNNRFLEEAAFNTVESLQKLLENAVKQGKISEKILPNPSGENDKAAIATANAAANESKNKENAIVKIEAEEIPEIGKRWVDALDRYVVLNVKSPQDPYLDAKYAFLAAKVFYDYKDFPEARKRFEWIVEHYPSNEVGYMAGSLILDTYRQEGDYDKLTQYAKKLTDTLQGEQSGALQDEINSFQLGALFRAAEQLSKDGHYEESAEEYLRIISKFPKGQFVAKALNNAAVAYEQIRRYDSAMKLFRRVYTEFPDDPLASYSLYRMAVNQERFFDFDDAIKSYELFYNKYQDPKYQKGLNEVGLANFNIEEKRRQALLSAAILTENMQRYAEAAQKFQQYADTYPNSNDSAAVAWRVVEDWKKAGDTAKMNSAIVDFIRKYGNNASQNAHVLDGLLRLGHYAEDQGDAREAEKRYRDVLKAYQDRNVQPGDDAAKFAAEAQFRIANLKFLDWDKIKIDGPLKRQKRLLKMKIDGQKELTTEFEKVFNYKDFDWTLAANYRIGALFQQFAFALYEVPIPFPEGSEQEEIYKTQLEDIALPLEDKAVERYERNINEARQKKVVNEWTKKTLEQLNKYKPAEYPLFKEERGGYDTNTNTSTQIITADGWKKSQRKG